MPRASEWDREIRGREVPPPTMPRLAFTDYDTEIEAQEAAARVAERRVVRQGLDAWRAIGKAESFEAWKVIGAALMVGRNIAMRKTFANRPQGPRYCRELGKWCREYGFGGIHKAIRTAAIDLHENISAIEAWRMSLPERKRKRMQGPWQNVRQWRAATQSNGKCPQDLKRDAAAAWRRFVSCVKALPADQAAPLWQMGATEAAAMQG
jgi:hypothetical protein